MSKQRRTFSSAFKTKVALEAIKERKTISELAAEYELHPNQIQTWKQALIERAELAFDQGKSSIDQAKEFEKEREDLFKQIGKPQVENDWLKKKVL